jgi:phosphoglycolate phosphatase
VSQARHVIFDLDGTLVDSAPGILAAFRAVLTAHQIAPRVPLDQAIIGPPLQETLTLLTGVKDESVLVQLANDFKQRYDTEGVLATPAYPGIAELLTKLREQNRTLHIATNKRFAPSRSIVAHLGWSANFSSLHALDMYAPRLANKAVMLANLLRELNLSSDNCVYVGDKIEDAEAADNNQLPFIAAQWGYGNFTQSNHPQHWKFAESPTALKTLLLS